MNAIASSSTAAGPASPLITDQLNAEWKSLASQPLPNHWTMSAFTDCLSLGEALDTVNAARRHDQATADTLLLELLTRHIDHGDKLAGRVVLQAILGRAVNLARRAHRFGAIGARGNLHQLMAAAVAGLWNAIADYPVHRRQSKVSVNLCMEALRHFTTLLDDHAPQVVDSTVLESIEPLFTQHSPAPAIELLNVLAWGIDTAAITAGEAALLTRVYCPGPGQEGGALAVAGELGLAPAAVRQRCSRAAKRLATAVRARPDLLDNELDRTEPAFDNSDSLINIRSLLIRESSCLI